MVQIPATSMTVAEELMTCGIPGCLTTLSEYRNVPTFLDRQVLANSADPDQTEEQSDQGLHCL